MDIQLQLSKPRFISKLLADPHFYLSNTITVTKLCLICSF